MRPLVSDLLDAGGSGVEELAWPGPTRRATAICAPIVQTSWSAGLSRASPVPSAGLGGRLRWRYGLWLWFGFRRGQRPSPPGSRRWCRRLWLWSGRRPWRRRRVRRPRSRRRLRMRHRRRLRWSGRPASRAARRRVRRGLRQAQPAVMAARTSASGSRLRRGTERVKGVAMPSGASLSSARDTRKGLRALARWPACCRLRPGRARAGTGS